VSAAVALLIATAVVSIITTGVLTRRSTAERVRARQERPMFVGAEVPRTALGERVARAVVLCRPLVVMCDDMVEQMVRRDIVRTAADQLGRDVTFAPAGDSFSDFVARFTRRSAVRS
jgi:hypothetical protein